LHYLFAALVATVDVNSIENNKINKQRKTKLKRIEEERRERERERKRAINLSYRAGFTMRNNNSISSFIIIIPL
jgi:hypothetical protein